MFTAPGLAPVKAIVAGCMSVAGMSFHAWLGGTKEAAGAARKQLMALHGVAMFLSLLGGMGAAATAGFLGGEAGFPHWVMLKLVLWLIFGALPVLPYRKPEHSKWLFVAVPLLVAFAAWTAGGFLPLTR